jgi:cytochrome c5
MTQSGAASLFLPALQRIAGAAVVILIACYFLSGRHDKSAPANAMTDEAIAARLQPVARAVVEAPAAESSASSGPLKGQAVFEQVCVACHKEGLAGAPKLGDRKAWGPRIAQGFNVLVKHAINGFTGKSGAMPPKGGGSFEDVEVARAVAYMADKAGASFPEPAAPAKK